MKSNIILCTGGARSGKSEFAETLTLSLPGVKNYIATAQIFDAEMEERVCKHRARRGLQWHTHEIPTGLAEQWPTLSLKGDIFLIDCVTMYITNYLMEEHDFESPESRAQLMSTIHNEIENLCTAILNSDNKTVIFVTNELGLGVIPDNAMARLFRDLAGEANQMIAKVASAVYLTISGITLEIKSQGVHING